MGVTLKVIVLSGLFTSRQALPAPSADSSSLRSSTDFIGAVAALRAATAPMKSVEERSEEESAEGAGRAWRLVNSPDNTMTLRVTPIHPISFLQYSNRSFYLKR